MNKWKRFIEDPSTFDALVTAAVEFLSAFSGKPIPIIFDDQRHYLPGGKISYNARRYRSSAGVPCISLRVKDYQSGKLMVFDDYSAIHQIYQWYRANDEIPSNLVVHRAPSEDSRVAPSAQEKPENFWRWAYRTWTRKRPIGFSPYLERKKVLDQGLKENAIRFDEDGTVFALLQDMKGWTQGVQKINPDGEKRLSKGSRKEGAAVWLTSPIPFKLTPKIIFVCEGVATGLTLRKFFPFPVLCALDASNLPGTVGMCRQISPVGEILIAADNDCHKPGKANVGLESAKIAEAAYGAKILIPPVYNLDQTDWNDVYCFCPDNFSDLITQETLKASGNALASVKSTIHFVG